EMPLDTVILATGELPDLAFLAGSGVRHDGRVGVRFTGATSRPGVFAAGDAAFGHGTVTQAVGEGSRAADAVADYLHQGRQP
ncbi:MAG TPA: FAD-dependent oxidoreductase, partial [Longimicrobiales bacterium]|nr:FAD-dependent oxidoreductase [Longimicrobiales bacterium]